MKKDYLLIRWEGIYFKRSGGIFFLPSTVIALENKKERDGVGEEDDKL